MTTGPAILLLASGRGERFHASGGQGSKLRALLGGKPIIEWSMAAARRSGLRVHVEDVGHPGMGDSIAAAVVATANASGWLVLPADLPLVGVATLRAVARALAPDSVVVPTYEGTRGHPVAFGRAWGTALARLAGPQGAAAVVRGAAAEGKLVLLPVEDRGIVTDIDTLDDLAAAEALLSARSA